MHVREEADGEEGIIKEGHDEEAVREEARREEAHREQEGARETAPRTDRIIIPHDDHHGRHVGKTASGHQFFITTPFEWLGNSREFVALYLFDPEGDLADAVIDDLGDRAALVGEDRAGILPGNKAGANSVTEQRIARHLRYVGPHELQDISVKPFAIERHGIQFGLVPRLNGPPRSSTVCVRAVVPSRP